MSYDMALEQVCAHEVKMESVSLAAGTSDTIRFPAAPSNSNVSLFINGLSVPPVGLYSSPSLPFTNQEPYRIVTGQSDLLYVKVGSGTPRIIPLLTGNSIKASDIARYLNIKIPDLSFEVLNNRVVVTSTISSTTFSFPDPRWTDKTSSLPTTSRILGGFSQVGIVPGRVATGRKIFPGWFLAKDTTSPIAGVQQLMFTEPLKNANPVFQLGYFTNASNCRRCHGTYIEFDYSIKNGTYETVSDADLLSQEFDKFVFTTVGSHFKWNWLGSNLTNRIGGKSITASSTASAMITVDISQAFSIYQNIKSQQNKGYPFQRVSDAEFPRSLGGIIVQNPPGDQTVAIVVVSIVSRSQEPVTLKRVIGTPNPFMLGNGNGGFFGI